MEDIYIEGPHDGNPFEGEFDGEYCQAVVKPKATEYKNEHLDELKEKFGYDHGKMATSDMVCAVDGGITFAIGNHPLTVFADEEDLVVIYSKTGPYKVFQQLPNFRGFVRLKKTEGGRPIDSYVYFTLSPLAEPV